MFRDSDLFIEYGREDFHRSSAGENESAAPLRFPDPAPSSLEGFDVSAAESGEGRYHSLFCGTLWLGAPGPRKRFVRALGNLLVLYRRKLKVPRQGPFLICGIGNAEASADSLGPRAASKVLVTDAVMREAGLPAVAAIRTGVPKDTGIDTADMIKAVAAQAGAALIVTVDSLCAKSGPRLGTVAQVTDCGVIPGSALDHSAGEISRRTMPCPVLSVGVPTVVRASALNRDEKARNDRRSPGDPLFVSRADTDAMVACYASLIAQAVNAAFSGNLPDDVMDPAGRA